MSDYDFKKILKESLEYKNSLKNEASPDYGAAMRKGAETGKGWLNKLFGGDESSDTNLKGTNKSDANDEESGEESSDDLYNNLTSNLNAIVDDESSEKKTKRNATKALRALKKAYKIKDSVGEDMFKTAIEKIANEMSDTMKATEPEGGAEVDVADDESEEATVATDDTEAEATTLSNLLLDPVNPKDRTKGFKPKEYEPGSMESRINIALNNLSDPGLRSNYLKFKQNPNSANRKSFMSNLNNLKQALDKANVKIESKEKNNKKLISEMRIINKSKIDTSPIEEMIRDFYPFAKNRFDFNQDPVLEFISDEQNANNILGKTAYYNPGNMQITVFVDKRHPKDIMRSFSHELVHHTQNCNGELDLSQEAGEGYAQENPHLRKMEERANLEGNMCFRDWEDGYKKSNPLQEHRERVYYKLIRKFW